MTRSAALLAAATLALALAGCKALRGLGPDFRDGVGGPPMTALAPWSLRLDRPRRSLVWWTASPWRRLLGGWRVTVERRAGRD